jgi:hypothetical protein
VGGGGGGRSLPSANPDNVAAGGATDARCGGRGERRGGMGQITAHSNPHSSFSLSFFPLCVRLGFDEKILHLAVQHNNVLSPQFPHSRVCEQFLHILPGLSACFAAVKEADRS